MIERKLNEISLAIQPLVSEVYTFMPSIMQGNSYYSLNDMVNAGDAGGAVTSMWMFYFKRVE